MSEQEGSLREEYTEATARLSEHVRFIAFGIIAVVYALYMSESALALAIAKAHPIELTIAAAMAIAAILLDYLQYLASQLASRKAYDEADFKWDENSWSYRGSEMAFVAKQAVAIVATLFILWVMLNVPSLHVLRANTSHEVSATEKTFPEAA